MTTSNDTAALNTLLRSVRDAIDAYLRSVDGAPAPAATTPAPARPTAAAPAGAGASSPAFDETRRVILAKMVERTGYPEEMLDLDLDLEADLGIDTVKQVAIYGAAREVLGLELDPTFKLREHNTLRKVITAMAKRLPGA